jgi:hypothetical protein
LPLVEVEQEGDQVILPLQEQAEQVLFVGHRGAMAALMEEDVQREHRGVAQAEPQLLMEPAEPEEGYLVAGAPRDLEAVFLVKQDP